VSSHWPRTLQRQPIDEEEEITREAEIRIEDEEDQADLAAAGLPEAGLPESEEQDEDETILQAKREPGASAEAPPDLLTRVAALRDRGRPLPSPQRDMLQSHFGYDFSQVRVHADDQAAKLARSLRARAFTVGLDVAFGAGEYRPETRADNA
jgi:hypothetical protein